MYSSLSNTIQNVISFTWPMVIISMVVIISFRIAYLIQNKERLVLYKDLTLLVFIVYILCLFQVVSFQDNVTWSSNNFIPFREMFRYKITSRLFIKNVLGNVLLFLPFGFFVSFYLKVEDKKWPLFLTLITSISIEVVQMIIGRVFDVDDIILNLVGGLVGYYIYDILKKVSEGLPSFCKKEWFLNIISILLLIGLIVLII